MPTYSGTSVIPSGSFSVNVKLSDLGCLPFSSSSYSVSISASNYESSNTWVKNLSSDEFIINSYSSGVYKWIATDQEGPGTQVLYGTDNPPPAELGNVGDSYINTASGNMYSKTASITTDWAEHTFVGNTAWTSIASSADGTKLAACIDGGYIWTSTDSGQTWVEQTGSGERYWNDIASSADGTKLIAAPYANDTGYRSYIYTSKDSGQTWVPRYNAGYYEWNSVSSDSTGTVLVASTYDTNYFYVSKDSGETWVQQSIATENYWSGVEVSGDAFKIVASDSGGYLYVGTRGQFGYTWVQQETLTQNYWTAVTSNSDGSVLAACGQNDYIYVGTLGQSGYDWVQQTALGQNTWTNIKSSADGSVLIASAYDSYIYVGTLDTGVYTWVIQDPSPGVSDWYALSMSNDGTKFAVGNYNSGSIWTYGSPRYTTAWTFELNVGGATGSIPSAAGPTGSIQLSDGAGGFTGSTGFYYQSDINFYALHGGPNGNIIGFDDGIGSMSVGVGNTGGSLVLSSGVSGSVQLNGGSLQVGIGGTGGSSGQYLGSDGAGNVVWSTPAGFTFSGPTGAILYYDGSAVTGSSGTIYDDSKNRFYSNGNSLSLLDNHGTMLLDVSANPTSQIYLYTDGTSGSIELSTSQLIVNLPIASGAAGSTGQYLGSDGAGNVTWSTPSYPTAQGPTGAIQYSNGAGGFTGDAGFLWTETGGMGDAFRLNGGPNGNFINLDETGNMAMYVGTPNVGKSIELTAGSSQIKVKDLVSGGGATPGTIVISIGGVEGTTGEYLGSDGAGNVVWSTPSISGLSFTGPTGAILYYDGSAVTGSTAMTYDGQYTLESINTNGTNSFALDDGTGNAQLNAQAGITLSASVDVPGNIALTTGNGRISLITAVPSSIVLDESGNVQLNSEPSHYLQVSTHGSTGTTGQYLGSDGAGNVTWSTPVIPRVIYDTSANISLSNYPIEVMNTGSFIPDITGLATIQAVVTVRAGDNHGTEITLYCDDNDGHAVASDMSVTSTGNNHLMSLSVIGQMAVQKGIHMEIGTYLILDNPVHPVQYVSGYMMVTYNLLDSLPVL